MSVVYTCPIIGLLNTSLKLGSYTKPKLHKCYRNIIAKKEIIQLSENVFYNAYKSAQNFNIEHTNGSVCQLFLISYTAYSTV